MKWWKGHVKQKALSSVRYWDGANRCSSTGGQSHKIFKLLGDKCCRLHWVQQKHRLSCGGADQIRNASATGKYWKQITVTRAPWPLSRLVWETEWQRLHTVAQSNFKKKELVLNECAWWVKPFLVVSPPTRHHCPSAGQSVKIIKWICYAHTLIVST